MNWQRFVDPVFPVVEPFTADQLAAMERQRRDDLAAIAAEDWSPEEARALDEAQRVAAAEQERLKTAEAKATTYLATLAALIPLVITIEGSYWERKSGPTPEWLKLLVLAVATVHVAAAGYHAFKALQVSAFQRVTEFGLVDAWRSRHPMRQLTRETLAATRSSKDAVNAKVTRVKVTQAHLMRAFAAFIVLLLLDPAFRAFGSGGSSRPDEGTRRIVTDGSSRTVVTGTPAITAAPSAGGGSATGSDGRLPASGGAPCSRSTEGGRPADAGEREPASACRPPAAAPGVPDRRLDATSCRPARPVSRHREGTRRASAGPARSPAELPSSSVCAPTGPSPLG